MSLICISSQTPGSDGTGKSTCEKGGRDPPDKTLDEIAKDLLAFFKGCESFNKPEEKIKKKYDIKMEHEHNCWPEDDIKRAWGKIQRMDINSDKRKDWSVVIILQMVKRSFVCGKCKLQAVQENRHATTEEQGCETTRSLNGNSEERSSQSNDDLGTVRAAGEQCSGGKPTTYSYYIQPYSVSQGQAGTQSPGWSQATGISSGAPDGQVRADEASQNQGQQYRETIYIRIPLELMFHSELGVTAQPAQPVKSRYKLINGFPSAVNYDLRKRKSYAMLFNKGTNNADWVYEILNKDTLTECDVKKGVSAPYHRGHLAAARNHRWCQEAYHDTYLNSNIVPQNSTLNNGPWSSLEDDCRKLITGNMNNIRNVHVYTGPLYRRLMNPPWFEEKLVPSHFFKVIIVENNDGTVEEPKCYEFPNGNLDQENLGVSREHRKETTEYIQSVPGLTFIERRPGGTQSQTITVDLRGVDVNQESRTARIEVKLA